MVVSLVLSKSAVFKLIAAGALLAVPMLPSLGQAQTTQMQTLTMGTEADYIPFEYRYASDPPSGIVGFDIDIANRLSERLGFTLTIEERNFDALLPALQAGELDFAIAAITPTDERRQVVDFSEPYFETRNTLVSRRSSPVRSLSDLPGKRVAVQHGSIQEQALTQQMQAGLDVEVRAFGQINEMITAVREGQVDAAIVEELVAEAYLENNLSLDFDVLGEVPATPVAIAFPKGSPHVAAFNAALQEMRESGELEQLARQWFTAQP